MTGWRGIQCGLAEIYNARQSHFPASDILEAYYAVLVCQIAMPSNSQYNVSIQQLPLP